MKHHEGNLIITRENQNDYSELETVGGFVHLYKGAKLDAPKLEIVGEEVYLSDGATLEAPKLEIIGSYVSLREGAKLDAPKLEIVGEEVYLSDGATLEAPKLEIVGEEVYLSDGATLEAPKTLISNSRDAGDIAEINLNLSLWLKGVAIMDGILCHVLNEKQKGDTTIYKIRIIGKTETSFVAQRGETFSHGETIKEAIKDLIYKESDRDKSEFEHWKNNLDLKISLEDAIRGYRCITGACSQGTKNFVKSITVPKELTPNVVLEFAKGRYGFDEFEGFLKGDS